MISGNRDADDYSAGEDASDFDAMMLEPRTGQIVKLPSELDSAIDISIPEGAGDLNSRADITATSAAVEYDERYSLESAAFGTPEPASMLTSDRLLTDRALMRQPPQGGLRPFIYRASFGRINPGDSRRVRLDKALNSRIAARLGGDTKFVPVLTRKGGVGKTTVTTLLGMAMALQREDRVIAVDANPDRGTLAERVKRGTTKTVRDVVLRAPSIKGFQTFSEYVSRDSTRLDVLASEVDPNMSEAFDENDYNIVADEISRYYSVCVTDCGTGIVHSVMRAILGRANSLVVVSGGSVDEARLASETLTWLEANGYGQLVRNAVVALNTATYGTDLVKLGEIEAHFRSRVRALVRIPYDPQLAAGSEIRFERLHPSTQQAARDLAALVVDGLVAGSAT